MPNKIWTPAAIAATALGRLAAQADAEKARQVQKYFRETVRSFGVSSPQVRILAKELYELIKKNWAVQDAICLCDLLFPCPELEAKGVAALILTRYQKAFSRSLFRTVHGWLAKDYLDNWASVDVFCPQVLGTMLAKYPDLLAEIEKWAGESNRWVQRASIVAFLKLLKQEEFLGAAYKMTARHFNSSDDLVQKANGWLLREAGKRDMGRLEKFLLAHGPTMPRTTLRYAIERFPEKKRTELLLRTRAKK
jgi:3-methyladenine DNA glycosylase AlkD